VGFEPTIQAFERAKTVHASDGAATVTGSFTLSPGQIIEWLLDTTFKLPLFDASEATKNALLPTFLKTNCSE
jgi:hypothetical protein